LDLDLDLVGLFFFSVVFCCFSGGGFFGFFDLVLLLLGFAGVGWFVVVVVGGASVSGVSVVVVVVLMGDASDGDAGDDDEPGDVLGNGGPTCEVMSSSAVRPRLRFPRLALGPVPSVMGGIGVLHGLFDFREGFVLRWVGGLSVTGTRLAC
jgi:hypothetical protein